MGLGGVAAYFSLGKNIKPNKLKLEIDWPLQFPISDFTVGHHNYNIFTSASKKRNQRRRLIVSLPPSSAKFKKPHPGSGLATAKGLTKNLTTEVALTTSEVTVAKSNRTGDGYPFNSSSSNPTSSKFWIQSRANFLCL